MQRFLIALLLSPFVGCGNGAAPRTNATAADPQGPPVSVLRRMGDDLKAADPRRRAKAAEQLGNLGRQSLPYVAALESAVETDPESIVKTKAGEALQKIRAASAED